MFRRIFALIGAIILVSAASMSVAQGSTERSGSEHTVVSVGNGSAVDAPSTNAATPLISFEWDTAVAGGPSGEHELACSSQLGVTACFQAYGDVFFVYDGAKDSMSGVARWWNYRSGNLYRYGGCRNKLGAGKWGHCNKNFYEDSIIALVACAYDGDTGRWYGDHC